MAELEQQIKELNRKIAQLVQRVQKGAAETIQNQGYTELRFIRDAYAKSYTFSRKTGRPLQLPNFGKRWKNIKEKNGWDSRRGWAKTSGLGGAVGNPTSMKRTRNGFVYDIVAGSSSVRNYWKSFRTKKRKGKGKGLGEPNSLMQFKKGVNRRMRDRLRKQIEILAREVFGPSAKVVNKRDGNVEITVSLEKGAGK